MNQTAQSESAKTVDVTSSLLSASELSVERLPMLQVLFEQVCEDFLQKLQTLSSAKIEISLQRVYTSTIEQAKISDGEHIIVQLEIAGDRPSAFFSTDRSALYILLECLLGASGKEKPYLDSREFTVLELLFTKTVATRAGMAFCQIFRDIVNLTTTASTAIPGNQIDTLSDTTDTFLTASIVIEAFERSGSINILIPQAILAPLKNRFVTVKNLEPLKADQPWIEHIKSQLEQTDMICRASLDGGQTTLGAISQLKVGQILELDIPSDRPVRFSSNEQDLYWCELGQSDGVFTLKVTEPISEKKSFLDEMLEHQEQSRAK